MMLAHSASAQGIAAVENICGRPREVDYLSIPAAAFTHPEISYVGMTEPAAKELGKAEGFEVVLSRLILREILRLLLKGKPTVQLR